MRRIISSWEVVAAGLLALGLGAAAFQGRFSGVYYGAVLAAGAISTCGFAAWIAPWLRIIWRSAAGKLLLAWLHAIAAVAALIPAQALVARALELPPQDFEITVALVAVLLWPVTWVYIVLLGRHPAELGLTLLESLLQSLHCSSDGCRAGWCSRQGLRR